MIGANIDWNRWKLTGFVNLYSIINIPLLAFVTPRVLELTERRSLIRIRLDRRSRNHLGVMYFGALAMGAELSVALKAIDAIAKSGKRIDFIFKDFSAEFLKRADGHVHFACDEVAAVQALIDQAVASPERAHQTFNGFAFVDGHEGEPVMKYKLTLSVKRRN